MCLIIIPYIFHFFEALIGHTRSDLAYMSIQTVFLGYYAQLDTGTGQGNELAYDGE